MSQKKIHLPLLFVGISVGIILAETLRLGFFFSTTLALISFVVIMSAYALHKERVLRGFVASLSVVLFAVAVGVVVSSFNQKEFKLTNFADQKVVLYGEVVEEVEDRGSYLQLIVSANVVETEDVCVEVSERTLVRADRFSGVSYGDSVKIAGSISLPEPFVTDTDRIFAYDEFLRKESVGTIISFAQVEVVDTGGGNFIKSSLLKVKSAYLSSIKRYIPDPAASLLGGLTVGTKQALGKDLERDFRVTGIIHIVVLSGYNVVIIAEAIMFTLRYFSTRVRTVLGVIAIGLFAVLVGGGATVVRAAVMAAVALVARMFGREALAIQALFFAGAIMLLFNPLLLLHDPSFQLSFLATLGLILLSERFEKIFSWIRHKGFREITTATFAVQITVLPLLLYMVGELSIVALPVNLLVLTSVPIAMLLGFLTGVFGLVPLVSTFLAPVFGILAFLVLKYELVVIDIFARLPFAAVTLPEFPFLFVIIIYALMIFLFLKTKAPRSLEWGA